MVVPGSNEGVVAVALLPQYGVNVLCLSGGRAMPKIESEPYKLEDDRK